MSVDLGDTRSEGRPDEGDVVTGVEDIEGSSGDGDDRVEVGRDQWTTVICGPGADTVRITEAKPVRASPTCERFTFAVNDAVGALRFEPGGVLVVPCPLGRNGNRSARCRVEADVYNIRSVTRSAVINRGSSARLRFGDTLTRGRVLIVLRLRDPGRRELRFELNVEPPSFGS